MGDKGYYVINNILHTVSCKKCVNALSRGFPNKYVDTLDDVLSEDIKACKCCKDKLKNYRGYKQIQEAQDNFLRLLKVYTDKYHYSVVVLPNSDFEVSTNIEKWVIHVTSFEEDNLAKVVLYHKNNLLFHNNGKCGSSIYPEYHVQFKSSSTPCELITYMAKHEADKWGAKIEVASTGTIFTKV